MSNPRDERGFAARSDPGRRDYVAAAGGALTFGTIVSNAVAVAERNRNIMLIVVAAMIVADLVLNLVAGERGSNTLGSVVSLIASFLLTRELLRAERLVDREGGFWPYLGASLLIGLAVAFGSILLIVPGLYLLARWAIAPVLVLARKLGPIEAMTESWNRTRDVAWTLVGFYVVFGLALLVLAFVVGGVSAFAGGGASSLFALLVGSAISNLFLVASAAVSVGIYRLLGGSAGTVRDVFE